LKTKTKLKYYKIELFEKSHYPRGTWKIINKVTSKNSINNSKPVSQQNVNGASSLPPSQPVAQALNKFLHELVHNLPVPYIPL